MMIATMILAATIAATPVPDTVKGTFYTLQFNVFPSKSYFRCRMEKGGLLIYPIDNPKCEMRNGSRNQMECIEIEGCENCRCDKEPTK